MTELATQSQNRGLSTLSSLRKGLANVAQSMPAKLGGKPILRLGKDLIWVYGQDNVEVQEGSLWAINPYTLSHGYVAWTRWEDYKSKKANELVGETMVSMSTPLPNVSDLRKYEVEGHPGSFWEYTEAVSFEITCISGEDKGETVIYKPTSVGGINAVREMIDKIMVQLDTDESKPVPVVNLDGSSYTHKRYGKVAIPVFTVKSWAAMEASEDGTVEQAAVEETKAAAPARTRRAPAAAAPAPEPEPEAEEVAQETVAAAAPEGRVRRRRA